MFLFLWVVSFGIKVIVTFFYAKNLIIHVISLSSKIRGCCYFSPFWKNHVVTKTKLVRKDIPKYVISNFSGHLNVLEIKDVLSKLLQLLQIYLFWNNSSVSTTSILDNFKDK